MCGFDYVAVHMPLLFLPPPYTFLTSSGLPLGLQNLVFAVGSCRSGSTAVAVTVWDGTARAGHVCTLIAHDWLDNNITRLRRYEKMTNDI